MHYAVKITAAMTAGLLLSVTALSPAFAQDKGTMVFVANVSSDFWKAAEAGAKKAQAELPGYTLEVKYPDAGTIASQQQLMDNLVTAGAKAIIVSSDDLKATDVFNKIAGETALFTTDSDMPQTNRIAYIGSSNVLAGGQVAEIVKKALPNGAKCEGFVGLLDAPNYLERKQGFVDGIKGSNITLVDVRADNADQTRAKANVADVLTADPTINCLVGFYSYNVPQIYQAVKDAGKLGQVTIAGFDDDPVTLGGIKEGNIAGTVVQQPFEWTYQGFKLMAAYLAGDKSGIPATKQVIVPTKIIYQADVDAYAAAEKALMGK
jgi:ribose transport system substrate-binding protein